MALNTFDNYHLRLSKYGSSNRDAIRRQSLKVKEDTFEETQSYKTVYINGEKYDARITTESRDSFKTGFGAYAIEFRNKDRFYPGTYIQIENIYEELEIWLLVDVVNDLFFPRHIIKKCNCNLKWKNERGEIVERWVATDDSYKLYDATRNYDNFITLPDSNIAIILPYDSETVKLRFDKRFLIDAPDITLEPDAWKVANRNAVSRLYKNTGVIVLSLSRDQFNHETDNAELMVADYYSGDLPVPDSDKPLFDEVNAEFTFNGQPKIYIGTPKKEFTLLFKDRYGELVDGVKCGFEVMVLPEFEQFFEYTVIENKIQIAVKYCENLINYKFKIRGYSEDETVSTELIVKVVSVV